MPELSLEEEAGNAQGKGGGGNDGAWTQHGAWIVLEQVFWVD